MVLYTFLLASIAASAPPALSFLLPASLLSEVETPLAAAIDSSGRLAAIAPPASLQLQPRGAWSPLPPASARATGALLALRSSRGGDVLISFAGSLGSTSESLLDAWILSNSSREWALMGVEYAGDTTDSDAPPAAAGAACAVIRGDSGGATDDEALDGVACVGTSTNDLYFGVVHEGTENVAPRIEWARVRDKRDTVASQGGIASARAIAATARPILSDDGGVPGVEDSLWTWGAPGSEDATALTRFVWTTAERANASARVTARTVIAAAVARGVWERLDFDDADSPRERALEDSTNGAAAAGVAAFTRAIRSADAESASCPAAVVGDGAAARLLPSVSRARPRFIFAHATTENAPVLALFNGEEEVDARGGGAPAWVLFISAVARPPAAPQPDDEGAKSGRRVSALEVGVAWARGCAVGDYSGGDQGVSPVVDRGARPSAPMGAPARIAAAVRGLGPVNAAWVVAALEANETGGDGGAPAPPVPLVADRFASIALSPPPAPASIVRVAATFAATLGVGETAARAWASALADASGEDVGTALDASLARSRPRSPRLAVVSVFAQRAQVWVGGGGRIGGGLGAKPRIPRLPKTLPQGAAASVSSNADDGARKKLPQYDSASLLLPLLGAVVLCTVTGFVCSARNAKGKGVLPGAAAPRRPQSNWCGCCCCRARSDSDKVHAKPASLQQQPRPRLPQYLSRPRDRID